MRKGIMDEANEGVVDVILMVSWKGKGERGC